MHHNNDGDWCSLSQEIASKLEKGKTYVFSYRYRTEDKVDIGIRFTEPSTIVHSTALNEDYGGYHPLVADGKWHTDSFEFTVTDNHPRPDEPLFGIFFDYHNTGDVDIDDVIIAEKDSCQVSPPGENGTIDLNRGLVAYWSFDNCDAKDDSGNGHDGEIHGNPECVDGVVGKAFYFNWGDYIKTIGKIKWISNSFTITGWLKPDYMENTPDGAWLGFVSKGGNDDLCSNENSFNFEFYNGKGHVRFGEICWYGKFTTSPLLEVQNFRFVTVTYDGSKLVFYSNGEKISEHSITGSVNSTASPIYIGVDFPGSDNYYQGILDEIRIYNRVLTEDEIRALYEMGRKNLEE
jgi:hypothetical protein